MTHKIFLLTLTLIILASLLSACAGGTAYTASSWAGMVADEETVYLANGSHIYAVNLANGSEKWRFPTKPEKDKSFFAAPALTLDGQLIVPGYDFKVYSLDPATGMTKWVFEGATDRYVASPLVTEKGIYVPSADGNLYAIDFSGSLLWTFKNGEALWASPASDETCGCIFVASMDHHVYAVDAQTGEELWKSDDLGGSTIGTPAYDQANKMLYLGTFGSEVVALDVKTGVVSWRRPTEDWVWSGMALQENILYFGDAKGNFYALDAADGAQLWKIQPIPDSPIVSTPTLSEGNIFFTSESATVYGVDKVGSVVWNQAVAAKLYTSPLIVNDTILVAEVEGEALLVALNLNGAQKWAYLPAK